MKIYKGDEALALSTLGRVNLIYGYTGTGKSSLALSATKNKKVLYLDVENAVGKVWGSIPDDQKDKKNLSSAKVNNIEELVEFLSTPGLTKGYDLIVIDSLTFLAEQELGNVTDEGRKLTFNHYGDLGETVKRVLRIAQMRGINIDIIMQAEQIQGEDGRMMYFPRAAGKQIVPAVIERADNIIYINLTKEGRQGFTRPSNTWHAKYRDPLPAVIDEDKLYYSEIERYFQTYTPQKADKKELLELLKKAKVKTPEKVFERIGWDPKTDLTTFQLEEAKQLLAKQIEANSVDIKLKTNESD